MFLPTLPTALLIAATGCGGYGQFLPEPTPSSSPGRADMTAFIHANAAMLERFRHDLATGEPSRMRGWAPIAATLDELGSQRDNVHGLYWFTDLDLALSESRATGRPVLSLRLLGRLDDELSCANSRFFRTALYANETVAAIMRDDYILHWESVRPAPVMTIDFGGGRAITRTITGNACHLLLDGSGRPFDVIPGLYGPAEFAAQLTRGLEFAHRLQEASGAEWSVVLAACHADAEADWRDRSSAFASRASFVANRGQGNALLAGSRPGPPPAIAAERLTVSKAMIEVPALERAPIPGENEIDFTAFAQSHPETLDGTSRGLIRRHRPELADATFDEMIRRFEDALALDTVRNEVLLHRRIHERFASRGAANDSAALVEWIYDELFLTPDSDPWLGLYDQTIYSGLTTHTEFSRQ